jgi:hypothetical protein
VVERTEFLNSKITIGLFDGLIDHRRWNQLQNLTQCVLSEIIFTFTHVLFGCAKTKWH